MNSNQSHSNMTPRSGDPNAFTRTLAWIGIAAAVHIVLITAVSVLWPKSSPADANTPAALTQPSSTPVAANAPAKPPANIPDVLDENRMMNDRSNSAQIKALNEKLPPPTSGPESGGGVNVPD